MAHDTEETTTDEAQNTTNNSNVRVEGEISAGWTGYYDPETTPPEYVTDPETDDVAFDFIPSDVDADELNDAQIEILRLASIGTYDSMKALSDAWEEKTAMDEITSSPYEYVVETLRDNAPELHERVKSHGRPNLPTSEIWRELAENGPMTVAEIADRVDRVYGGIVQRMRRGDCFERIGTDGERAYVWTAAPHDEVADAFDPDTYAELINAAAAHYDALDDGDDVSPDELRVTILLEQNDGTVLQSEVGETFGWSQSKVSRLISDMADAGRVEKAKDGRTNRISLPDAEGGEGDSTDAPPIDEPDEVVTDDLEAEIDAEAEELLAETEDGETDDEDDFDEDAWNDLADSVDELVEFAEAHEDDLGALDAALPDPTDEPPEAVADDGDDTIPVPVDAVIKLRGLADYAKGFGDTSQRRLARTVLAELPTVDSDGDEADE